MMPTEMTQAIQWALQQTYNDGTGTQQPITKETPQPLVDAVRQWFNDHGVQYSTFSYDDLKPYL